MSKKETIIFIPGLLCDRELWADQINFLQSHYDIQVADITGYETMEELARHILANAPKQFYLCGLSMGGYVAQEIMRQAGNRVLKLVLINTSSKKDTPEDTRLRQGLMAMAKTGEFKGVTPRLLPSLIHKSRLGDEKLAKTIMDMATRVGRDAFFNQQKAILSRVDGRPSLKEINVPTLVIGGRQDTKTPPDHSEEMADLIPKSKLIILDECGHLAPLEKPNQVNQALHDFLSVE